MPSSLTQLGLFNAALYKIGATRMTAADLASPGTSNNPAAQYLTDIWQSNVDELLEEHPWSFAVQTVPLVPLNPPVWVTNTYYSVGNYVINGNNIYICIVSHTSGVFSSDLASKWTIQTGVAPLLIPLPVMNDGVSNPYFLPSDFINPYLFAACTFCRKEMIKPPYLTTPTICLILSNSNVGAMKYVWENLTPSLWSAKFYEAMACKLAWQLCFKISEAAQYAAALEQAYHKALISAITADSNTTSPDTAIADEWFEARLAGSGNALPWGVTPGSPSPQPY